jgi:diguanylate cyclase (GGDEF)-like protein/PAS domain S-box-containing protein
MDSLDSSSPRRETDAASQTDLNDRRPTLPPDITGLLSPEEQAGFFYTLVDAAADAILAHRPDGSVVYANTEAVRLLGYSDEKALLAMEPYGWIAKSQLQSAPRRMERALAEGLVTFEGGARRRDGLEIPTEVRSRRIDTPLGPMLIAVIRDTSHRVQARAAIEHLAYHDGLTDLSNRLHLEDRLGFAIADARRYGDLVAMACIDLDHFKRVNDEFGHAAGDRVLVEVARRLRVGVREQDTVARLGGDEFVVVFPRVATQEEAEAACERLAHIMEEPIAVGDSVVTVSISIGIAMFHPRVDDARSLLVKADIAMYSAKLDPVSPWLTYHAGMTLPDGPVGGPQFDAF